jgi:hypothetical protein
MHVDFLARATLCKGRFSAIVSQGHSVLDYFPSPLTGEGGGEKVLCFQSFIPLPLAPSRQGRGDAERPGKAFPGKLNGPDRFYSRVDGRSVMAYKMCSST